MGQEFLLLLGLVCYLFGIIIFTTEILYIKKKGKILLVSYVRLFYSVIYGFAPGAIYTFVYENGAINFSLSYIDFTDKGIDQLWLGFLLSVVALFFFNLGHLGFSRKEKMATIINKPQNEITDKSLFISAIILSIIGFVSLMLWTKVYGGPIAILPYANDLRAGRDIGIYNPFSFFMKLCLFSLFSSYLFFILYLSKKRGIVLLFFIFSASTTFLYLLANSGRMMFVIFFVMLLFIYEEHKGQQRDKRNYKKYAVLAIVALVIISASEPIMGIIQNSTITTAEVKINVNFIEILRNEFFFPSSSIQVALGAHESGTVGFRLLTDIISGLFAWLPSRFRPESIVQLEVVNTILKSGTTAYGGLPADLISLSIYDLGYIGVAIIPFIFGLIINKMQLSFNKKPKSNYNSMMYLLTAFYMLKAVPYADPANIMSNIFYVVMGNFLVKTIAKIKI